MSFTESIRTCFSKYGDFNGRARRSEFWWWHVFAIIVVGIPAAIGGTLLAAGIASGDSGSTSLAIGGTIIGLAFLVSFAILVPSYAVGCRRLHDKGISGWLQLIELIPAGGIVLIVLWALQGEPNANSYGDPVA